MPLRRQINRFVKLCVSIAVFLVDDIAYWLKRACGCKGNHGTVVLYYHSVLPQHRELFVNQMKVLLRLAAPMSLVEHKPLLGPRRYVAVTFDDAFESLVGNALPELERLAIPCTIFAVGGVLGQAAAWEDVGGETHGNEKIMSTDQLRRVVSPLVSIGSHTLTHPLLTRLDGPAAEKEISESREQLERLTGTQIRLFSFPYGAFNEQLIEMCRRAGYDRVFTTVPAPIHGQEFVVGRTPADPTESALEFHLKVYGAYRWIGAASVLKNNMRLFVRRLLSRPGLEKTETSDRRASA